MDTRRALLSDAGPPSPASTKPPDDGPPAPIAEAGVTVTVEPPLAFSDFYRQQWPRIASALTLTLGDRHLALEATDEAMVRAYPRWSNLRTYDNPGGWVYRVGLNWARSHHRRIARLIPFAHHDRAAIDDVSDPTIRDALLGLALKHRSVVVCRLLLDWSVDETAVALGIAPGTVKSRLHRALQILQPALAPERRATP